ncbi:esterase-like activity of phytase family protein [Aquimarina rhabdastrellae]
MLRIFKMCFCYCLGFFLTITAIAQEKNKTSYEIKYLDEFVFDNDNFFKGSKIGGLSAIEYYNNEYYLVCDDARAPRFYKAAITIEDQEIKTVNFDKVVNFPSTAFIENTHPDLEALRVFSGQEIIVSSEGSIHKNVNPEIFIVDEEGNFKKSYTLPSYFLLDGKNQPRHNGVFEGLCKDEQQNGFWTAMELPLVNDGEEPTIESPGAPVRITHFDKEKSKADFQFLYPLDKLTKDPKGRFGVNGVTALLQLDATTFLCLERGYSSGYGTQGNTVRIYQVDIREATNTLTWDTIKDKTYKVAQKTLIYDFEDARPALTRQIVDNIEGLTLGPKLKNGHDSLILVSDNNFNPKTKQINQFILLELKKRN